MFENIAFYIMFFVQLLVVSIIFPQKLFSRLSYVVKHYPREKYPKLYPNEQLEKEINNKGFIKLNRTMFYLGCCLIVGLVVWDINSQGYINEMLPVVFFLIQMVPLVVLECRERAYFNEMKKASNQVKRTSGLTPRKLTDFVPNWLMITTVSALLISIGIDVYVNRADDIYLLGVSQQTFYRTILLVGCNIMFLVVAYFNLYGKKIDPYQDNHDRLASIAANIISLFYISIAMSFYLGIREGTDDLSLEYLQAALMSLYCVVIAMMSLSARLSKLKVEAINFDVYKTP